MYGEEQKYFGVKFKILMFCEKTNFKIALLPQKSSVVFILDIEKKLT